MKHDHYHTMNTEERFSDLCELLIAGSKQDKPIIALDIETTGLDPWADDAAVVSLSLTLCDGSEDTWVVPLDHPEGPWGYEWEWRLGRVVGALTGWKIVAHNANFDLGYIRRFFLPDYPLFMWWDTQTAAHLLDENQSKRLKSLATPLMEGGDWAIDVTDTKAQPWFLLAAYNAFDTIATARLYRKQYDHEATGAVRNLLLRTVLPAQRALIDVTHTGLLLDTTQAHKALEGAEFRREQAQDVLFEVAVDEYGMDPTDRETYPTLSWEPTAKWFLAFTEEAVERNDLYVQEMTPGGRPSWRGGVLERLVREGNQIAEVLLDYRDASKKAQFISSWLDKADDTGRVHGNFNIARTRTGRLSSSDPNLQQVDRELKYLWTAPDLFCEVDYSQIEMRVAAEMIHRTVLPDNPMLEAFRERAYQISDGYSDPLDLHNMAATLVTGGDPEDVTPDERQKGKAVNFGFIFGMGPTKFVKYALETYGVEFTLAEAAKVRDGFFELWDGLADWHGYQIDRVRTDGYVTNLFGRRRRLPAAFSTDEWERSEAERQAINSPVQATASDLMLDSLANIHTKIDREEARIVGTVHDSVLMEVTNTGIVEDVCTMMTSPRISMAVPIEVEAAIGENWGNYDTEIIRSNT